MRKTKQIVLSHRLIDAFDLHYIHTFMSLVVVFIRKNQESCQFLATVFLRQGPINFI